MKRAYIYTTPQPNFDTTMPKRRAANSTLPTSFWMRQPGINPLQELPKEPVSLLNEGRILVIKFRSLLWHFHPKSTTSPEKAIKHQASSRLSFAIDTEFYHNHFNSRLYDNTICSVPPGAWRRQRFRNVLPHRAQDRRRQTAHSQQRRRDQNVSQPRTYRLP